MGWECRYSFPTFNLWSDPKAKPNEAKKAADGKAGGNSKTGEAKASTAAGSGGAAASGGGGGGESIERDDLYILLPRNSFGLKLRDFEVGGNGQSVFKLELKKRFKKKARGTVIVEEWKKLVKDVKITVQIDRNNESGTLASLHDAVTKALEKAAQEEKKDKKKEAIKACIKVLPKPDELSFARVSKARIEGTYPGVEKCEQTEVMFSVSKRLVRQSACVVVW